MAPALLFYSLVHTGQQGLVFVFLPGLLLLGGLGLDRMLPSRRVWTAALGLLVLAQIAFFCLVPEYPLGPGTRRMLTRETVFHSDRYYQDRFAVIRENLEPENTLILAANWDHVRYYLPTYDVLPFLAAHQAADQVGWGESSVAGGARIYRQGGLVVVLFDPVLVHYCRTPQLIRELSLEHGGKLEYLQLSEGMSLECDGASFGLVHD